MIRLRGLLLKNISEWRAIELLLYQGREGHHYHPSPLLVLLILFHKHLPPSLFLIELIWLFDLESEVQRRTEEALKRRADMEIKNKYIEDEVERCLKEYEDLPTIQDLSAPALR